MVSVRLLLATALLWCCIISLGFANHAQSKSYHPDLWEESLYDKEMYLLSQSYRVLIVDKDFEKSKKLLFELSESYRKNNVVWMVKDVELKIAAIEVLEQAPAADQRQMTEAFEHYLLADHSRSRGQLEPYFIHAVASYQAFTSHWNLTTTEFIWGLVHAAFILQYAGHHEDAIELAIYAADRAKEIYGPEHPLYGRVLGQLGRVQFDAGKSEIAEETLLQAAKLVEPCSGRFVFIQQKIHNDLADLLLERGDYDQALEYLVRARKLYPYRLPDNPEIKLELAVTDRLFGKYWYLQKNHKSAVTYFTKSLQQKQNKDSTILQESIATLIMISDCLVQLGNSEVSEAMKSVALDLEKKRQGFSSKVPPVRIEDGRLVIVREVKSEML